MTATPAYRPDPPAHHVAKPRRCLMCRTVFDSAWAGERICPDCKGGEVYETLLTCPDDDVTIESIGFDDYV